MLLIKALELAGQQGVTVDTLAEGIGLPTPYVSRIIGSLADPRPQVDV